VVRYRESGARSRMRP